MRQIKKNIFYRREFESLFFVSVFRFRYLGKDKFPVVKFLLFSEKFTVKTDSTG